MYLFNVNYKEYAYNTLSIGILQDYKNVKRAFYFLWQTQNLRVFMQDFILDGCQFWLVHKNSTIFNYCKICNNCQFFFFRLFRRISSRGCCYEFESFARRTMLVIGCIAMSRRLNRLIIFRKSLFSTLLLKKLLENSKHQ